MAGIAWGIVLAYDWNDQIKRSEPVSYRRPRLFFLIFIAQKVSNINLVTKDFKIVSLTNLLKLFLAWRVIGRGWGVCVVRFILTHSLPAI